MTIGPHSRIAIAGAGSIGCYIGGHLALAGRNVTILLRERLASAITRYGLRVSDLDGSDHTASPKLLKLAAAPETALKEAEIVLVTVKCFDTAEMADLISWYAPKEPIVVSLQNGVDNVRILGDCLDPERRVIAGMIPFNVVQTRKEREPPHFHRASSGTIEIGAGVEGLRELLDVPGAHFTERHDMEAVLWGKLLLNLNNALNALSGLPLATELADRRWRRLFAQQMDEAIAVLRAAGIHTASIEAVPPGLVPVALRLPNWLFRIVAKRVIAIDAHARSSMWDDLQAGRETEVDCLQGAIVALAEKASISAAFNATVTALIKRAEQAKRGSPGLTPEQVEMALSAPSA
jgi:2-dehydropantoate 2-reductase